MEKSVARSRCEEERFAQRRDSEADVSTDHGSYAQSQWTGSLYYSIQPIAHHRFCLKIDRSANDISKSCRVSFQFGNRGVDAGRCRPLQGRNLQQSAEQLVSRGRRQLQESSNRHQLSDLQTNRLLTGLLYVFIFQSMLTIYIFI
jgi:hypothetical protein